MFLKQKIIFVLVLFVSIFWYVVFSDAVNTSYTEFYFVSGVNHYTTISINLTWWETGNVDLYLENKSSSSLTVNMDFVDGGYTTDGSNIRMCLSENETNIFGDYVNMSSPTFTLNASTGLTGQLDLLFPSWYSGLYYGCVVYYPNVTEDNDSLNTVARKAIFLDVNVISTSAVFGIKIYPWSRGNTSNPNINGFENKGKLLFYASGNRTTVIYSGYIDTNAEWTWDYIENIADWYYDVVYKWWQQLASFISGIYITWWQELVLDFTTWSNLYGIESSSLIYNGWSGYQMAWDMMAVNNTYDYQINSTDLSVLYGSQCPYLSSVVGKHKCDLNNDGWVDSSDASVIIGHDWEEDLTYYDTWTGALFEWFGTANY